jgi:hypothetical protein
MKQERVILSFIMVLIGLLVAGIAFYFYQSTKVVSDKSSINSTNTVITPTPKPTIFLVLNEPSNEIVVSSKTLSVSGKTNPEATVIIITDSDQLVLKPSSQGDFSTTITLSNGQNLIRVRAVTPNAETAVTERIVTYSTEDF